MEFPYNREVFTDKYSRLAKDRPSRSILAHLSKDGLMYIHPEQVRSLTPREDGGDCSPFRTVSNFQWRARTNTD